MIEDPRRGPLPPERRGERHPRSATPVATPLERATSVLRRIAGAITRLAVAAFASGVLVWWAVQRAVEGGEDRTLLLVVVGVLLLAPPVVLALFVLAIRALIALPRRLRETPSALGERAGEIRRRATEVGEARRRGPLRALGALLGFWWSVASSRDVLRVVSPAMALLTPWTLVASLFAVVGAVFEILAGVIALVVLAT